MLWLGADARADNSQLSTARLFTFELEEIFRPPRNWAAQVTDLVLGSGRTVHLDGNSEDCREPSHTAGSTYSVVTGLDVAKRLTWLTGLYEDDLRAAIEGILRHRIYPASNAKHGVNINALIGTGSRYEWHVDPCPISAVLFVTSLPSGAGGALAVRVGDLFREIEPRAGLIVVFEGGRLEHTVMPLRSEVTRVSVPMLYYYDREKQSFPQDLDRYLYGAET